MSATAKDIGIEAASISDIFVPPSKSRKSETSPKGQRVVFIGRIRYLFVPILEAAIIDGEDGFDGVVLIGTAPINSVTVLLPAKPTANCIFEILTSVAVPSLKLQTRDGSTLSAQSVSITPYFPVRLLFETLTRSWI